MRCTDASGVITVSGFVTTIPGNIDQRNGRRGPCCLCQYSFTVSLKDGLIMRPIVRIPTTVAPPLDMADAALCAVAPVVRVSSMRGIRFPSISRTV